MTAAPPDLHEVNTSLSAPSSLHVPGPANNPAPGASSWQGVVATIQNAIDWGKNQMQFNPPKLYFERTHFMGITRLRLPCWTVRTGFFF